MCEARLRLVALPAQAPAWNAQAPRKVEAATGPGDRVRKLKDSEVTARALGSPADLKAEPRDHLARALKHAFPLPQSGEFTHLLAALGGSAKQKH